MKTNNTNFALLVSKNFTKPFKTPIEYGKQIAQLSNMLCDGKILVQTFGDFKRGRRTTEERLARNNLIPTLKDAVPEDFHPRFQETIKTYEYKIYNRQFPDPTKRLYTYFYYYPLDVQKMRQGAGYLIGEHDFKSFSTYKPEVENTVRTIYELDIHRSEDNVITIRIRGNGFLYNMVRIIAGTLIRVGGGYYPPEHVKEILEGKNRELAGETARPEGLTLVEIRYPEWEAKKDGHLVSLDPLSQKDDCDSD